MTDPDRQAKATDSAPPPGLLPGTVCTLYGLAVILIGREDSMPWIATVMWDDGRVTPVLWAALAPVTQIPSGSE